METIKREFLKRFIALIMDCTIVWLIATLFCMFFGEAFQGVGRQGVWIGIGMILFYYGLMNSILFQGQTFGKRMMKLQVIGVDLKPISMFKSILRAVILIAALYPSVLAALLAHNQVYGEVLLWSGVFGIWVSNLYCIGTKKRTLQDLILRTRVAEIKNGDLKGVQTRSKSEVTIAITLILIPIVVSAFMFKDVRYRYRGEENALVIEDQLKVDKIEINKSSDLWRIVIYNCQEPSYEKAKEVAEMVAEPNFRGVLTIRFYNGLDIGLVSKYKLNEFVIKGEDLNGFKEFKVQ